MKTLNGTNVRHGGWIGLAALGLALAGPVHAAPDYLDGAFIVAKRDRGEDVRQAPRDDRGEARRDNRREAEREESRGYGYGYERRQQQRDEGDDRRRDRR